MTRFSNCHNTWKPEHHLSPVLVLEYFQKSKLEQSPPTNAVCMMKVLAKEPLFTWRCFIPRLLILTCLLALWPLFAKAQATSIPAINLGPLHDCSQPQHLGIFAFPSLTNCSHNILQQDKAISTFRGEVLRYSPVATIFPIYYCTLETIHMTCHYDNIFKWKNCYRETRSVLLPGRSCLQAATNHTVPISHYNRTLTKVSDNHWKIPASPTYDCRFNKTIVNTYHNFHVRTYKAQLVGAATIMEQHLTTTPCSATIDTTLQMGSCIPQENPTNIIVWRDPHHNRQEMNTLRIHTIQQQGPYI